MLQFSITYYRYVHRYHRDGVESWTKKAHPHSLSCKYVSRRRGSGSDVPDQNSTIAFFSLQQHQKQDQQIDSFLSSPSPTGKRYLSRNEIIDFCKSVQLCQTCCRVEHDTTSEVAVGTGQDHTPRYALRNGSVEYEFLCEHLGKTLNDTQTLHGALEALPESQGLLTEASLDYYESLRMARIVNHTWNDPFTYVVLHILIYYFIGLLVIIKTEG